MYTCLDISLCVCVHVIKVIVYDRASNQICLQVHRGHGDEKKQKPSLAWSRYLSALTIHTLKPRSHKLESFPLHSNSVPRPVR